MPVSAQVFDFLKTSIDLRVYVTDERGIVVFDSDNGRDEGTDYSGWLDVSRTLRGEYGARTPRDPNVARSSIMYVAAPIRIDGLRLSAIHGRSV